MNIRLIEYGAFLLILIGAIAWIYHRGVEHERMAVAAAETSARAKAEKEYEAKAQTSQDIGDTFHEAVTAPVSAPVVRVVRVQSCARVRSAETAPAATEEHHEEATERSGDPVDIGAPLITVGRDADAQITALQSYITDVCLAR